MLKKGEYKTSKGKCSICLADEGIAVPSDLPNDRGSHNNDLHRFCTVFGIESRLKVT